jgi:hypothetical protein
MLLLSMIYDVHVGMEVLSSQHILPVCVCGGVRVDGGWEGV